MAKRAWIVVSSLVALAAVGAWIAFTGGDAGPGDRLGPAAQDLHAQDAEGAASPAVAPPVGEGAETRVPLDTRSSAAEAELAATPESPTHVLRGRVLDQARFPAGGAEVELRVPGVEAVLVSAAGDGAFELAAALPADREVRVVPWHPWLVPAEDGAASVRGGRDGVVLRLVAGDELLLSAPELAGIRRVRALRVARYEDGLGSELAPEPLAWHHAPLEEGVARCSMPRGRWTLWIDPGADFAPLLLRGALIAGRTEIDSELDRGSALRVRVRVPPDQSPPRIYVHASSGSRPEYRRDLNSSGEAEVVLSGLGPGRFQVRLSTILGPGQPQRHEIDLDGQSDHELELDLR